MLVTFLEMVSSTRAVNEKQISTRLIRMFQALEVTIRGFLVVQNTGENRPWQGRDLKRTFPMALAQFIRYL